MKSVSLSRPLKNPQRATAPSRPHSAGAGRAELKQNIHWKRERPDPHFGGARALFASGEISCIARKKFELLPVAATTLYLC